MRAEIHQPTQQPASASTGACRDSASAVPETDRRVILLETSVRYLQQARRFGDSCYRSTVERQLREDIAALQGAA